MNRWSDEDYCLEAVRNDGRALEYVEEQNELICLEAIRNFAVILS